MIYTDHLRLSCGVVYLRKLDDAELIEDDVELYRFKDGPDWPPELGEEPDWLEAEHEEIEDILCDARRCAAIDWHSYEHSYAMARGSI